MGEKLAFQKFDIKKKKYSDLVTPIDLSQYDLTPGADGFVPLWVSYAEGVMMIGTGEIGDAVLAVVNDPQQYSGIDAFGFMAEKGAELKGFSVAPQVAFGYQVGAELYKKPRQFPKFNGSMEIILPFEYTFEQAKGSPSIMCKDGVTKKETIAENTPEQGAQYFYAVKLDETGGVSLSGPGGPAIENPGVPGVTGGDRAWFASGGPDGSGGGDRLADKRQCDQCGGFCQRLEAQ